MKYYFFVFFLLTVCHQLGAYSSQNLLIINEASFPVKAEYKKPDPGFRGPNVLMKCTKTIQSNTFLRHTILVEKNVSKIKLFYVEGNESKTKNLSLSKNEFIVVNENEILKKNKTELTN